MDQVFPEYRFGVPGPFDGEGGFAADALRGRVARDLRGQRVAPLVLRVAVAAILVLQVGCAGFRSGVSEGDRAWPPAAGPVRPSISLAVFGRLSVEGKPEPLSPEIHLAWARICKDSFASSGLFSEVQPGAKEAELRADVEITVYKTFSKVMALVWEFTLFVVPFKETYEFTYTTTFRDAAGRTRGIVEKKETVVIWSEILLLFAAPFSTPMSAERAAMESLGRTTLLDAAEKGYVSP